MQQVTARQATKLEEMALQNLTTMEIYNLTPSRVAEIMTEIEIYSSDLRLIKERHLAAIKELDSDEALAEYDFTLGYPKQSVFTMK